MPKNALNFKKPSLLNKQSTLTFGQYRDMTLDEVMKFDASYLVWLVENKAIDVDVETWDEICKLDDDTDEYDDYETDSFSIY